MAVALDARRVSFSDADLRAGEAAEPQQLLDALSEPSPANILRWVGGGMCHANRKLWDGWDVVAPGAAGTHLQQASRLDRWSRWRPASQVYVAEGPQMRGSRRPADTTAPPAPPRLAPK